MENIIKNEKPMWRGVCTAVITPFSGGEIDYPALENILNIQIANGVASILVLGTTGEGPTISETERRLVVKFTTEVVRKRVPVIVGIGGNNPASIIKFGLCAKANGADAVMITAPYYNKTTQAGAVAFFNTVMNEIGMPVLVYNIPGRVAMNIEPATLAEICKNPHVIGVKESSGCIEQIQAIVDLCKGTPIYVGDDGLALASYAVGCIGVVSVTSNARPVEIVEIFELFDRGEVTIARKAFYDQLPFVKSLFTQVNPIPIKYEMARLNLCRNEVRLPLVPMLGR